MQCILHSQRRHLPVYLLPNIIYSEVLSLLNSKKAVRIQQFTDDTTIVLRKYTELNQIKYGFPSTCLSITTTTIISNFSVLILLNLNLIPSVKVLGNSNFLAILRPWHDFYINWNDHYHGKLVVNDAQLIYCGKYTPFACFML